MELVSVCSITYNQEKFARSLIESVAGQTWTNIEHIIIDDDSTDNTFNSLFEAYRPHCEILRNTSNMGASKNLDKAIRMAKGKYIALLEGDDLYKPDKLEKSIKFLEENDFDLICTDVDDVQDTYPEGNKVLGVLSGMQLPKLLTVNDHLRIDNRVYTSSVVAKADVLKKSPGFSGFYHMGFEMVGDYPLFLWLAHRYKLGFLSESLTIKRWCTESLCHNDSTRPQAIKEYGEEKARINDIITYEPNNHKK